MAQTSPRNLERNIRNEERRQAAADAAAAARRLYDQQILNSPGQLRTESAISPWRGRMSSGIKERLEAADVERRSYEAQLLNSPGMLRTESAISPWRGRMSSGIEELLAGPNREARRAKVYQESEAYRNQVDAYYNDKVRRGTAGLATPTTQSPLNNFLSELPGAVREQLSFSGSDTAGSDVGLEGNINRIYQQMIGQPAKAVGRFFTGDQRAAQIPPRQFEKFRIGDGGNVPQGAPQPTLPTHQTIAERTVAALNEGTGLPAAGGGNDFGNSLVPFSISPEDEAALDRDVASLRQRLVGPTPEQGKVPENNERLLNGLAASGLSIMDARNQFLNSLEKGTSGLETAMFGGVKDPAILIERIDREIQERRLNIQDPQNQRGSAQDLNRLSGRDAFQPGSKGFKAFIEDQSRGSIRNQKKQRDFEAQSEANREKFFTEARIEGEPRNSFEKRVKQAKKEATDRRAVDNAQKIAEAQVGVERAKVDAGIEIAGINADAVTEQTFTNASLALETTTRNIANTLALKKIDEATTQYLGNQGLEGIYVGIAAEAAKRAGGALLMANEAIGSRYMIAMSRVYLDTKTKAKAKDKQDLMRLEAIKSMREIEDAVKNATPEQKKELEALRKFVMAGFESTTG